MSGQPVWFSLGSVCRRDDLSNIYLCVLVVKSQGTAAQKSKWLPLAENYQIIGTYAQTEMGHGKTTLFVYP